MIRDARWKLLNANSIYGDPADATREFELYDMGNDPGEKHNIADANGEIVARLKAKYDAWFDDVTQCYSANYRLPRYRLERGMKNPTVLTRPVLAWRRMAPRFDRPWGFAGHGAAGLYDVTLLFDAKNIAEAASIQIGDMVKQMPVLAEARTAPFQT